MLSDVLIQPSRRRTWHHRVPSRATRSFAASGSARPRIERVRRGPAVLDLRRPALAVWSGEVVAVAGPRPHELLATMRDAQAHAAGRIDTVLVDLTSGATAAAAEAIAACVKPRRGLLVVLALVPDPSGRRALAALRRAVATSAPCRCVWLADGRVYPE